MPRGTRALNNVLRGTVPRRNPHGHSAVRSGLAKRGRRSLRAGPLVNRGRSRRWADKPLRPLRGSSCSRRPPGQAPPSPGTPGAPCAAHHDSAQPPHTCRVAQSQIAAPLSAREREGGGHHAWGRVRDGDRPPHAASSRHFPGPSVTLVSEDSWVFPGQGLRTEGGVTYPPLRGSCLVLLSHRVSRPQNPDKLAGRHPRPPCTPPEASC